MKKRTGFIVLALGILVSVSVRAQLTKPPLPASTPTIASMIEGEYFVGNRGHQAAEVVEAFAALLQPVERDQAPPATDDLKRCGERAAGRLANIPIQILPDHAPSCHVSQYLASVGILTDCAAARKRPL